MGRKSKDVVTECDIVDFSPQGYGLGYHTAGQPIEVFYTMPGERVKVRLLRKRRGIYSTWLEERLTNSPERSAARCKHFGVCGGCRWQHLGYEKQLALKEERVYKLFESFKSVEKHAIIPCDPPWRYRNKMEFSFSQDASGDKFLGLMKPQSKRRVVDLEECHLCSEWMMEATESVRKWWKESEISAYHPPKDAGSLRTLTLREGIRTGDKMVTMTVSGNADFALTQEQINAYVECLGKEVSIFIEIQQIKKGTPTQFYELHLQGATSIREKLIVNDHELEFVVSPKAFFQPNTLQAEKLYARAFELAKIPAQATVLDLYCGTGTLGLFAAKEAKKVIGIELCPEAVLDAKENIQLNKIENVEVHQGDVGQVLGQLSLEQVDLVIVDPPRAGLDDEAIAQLLSIAADKILYISCNAKSQAENLQKLTASRYQLTDLHAVDMFPMTVHCENIAILELVKS